jgi:hypothetical protein
MIDGLGRDARKGPHVWIELRRQSCSFVLAMRQKDSSLVSIYHNSVSP